MKQHEVYDRARERREEIARRVLDYGETGSAVARAMGLTRAHVNTTARRMLRQRQVRDHVISYHRHLRIQRRKLHYV